MHPGQGVQGAAEPERPAAVPHGTHRQAGRGEVPADPLGEGAGPDGLGDQPGEGAVREPGAVRAIRNGELQPDQRETDGGAADEPAGRIAGIL